MDIYEDIINNKERIFYSTKMIEFHYRKREDFDCKKCGVSLRIIKKRNGKMVIKSCNCVKSAGNYEYAFTVFGKNGIENAWKELTNSRKKPGPFKDLMIKKYGKEKGLKKYNKFLKDSKQNLDNFIKRHGEENGRRLYEEFLFKSSHKKDDLIKRYGKEEGIKRYNKKRNKMKKKSKFSFQFWLDKNNGDYDLAEKEYKDYQRRDVNFYIKKYGKIKGRERYREVCKSHQYHNTLGWYEEKYGKVEGLVKYEEYLDKCKRGIIGISLSDSSIYFFNKLVNELSNYIKTDKIFYGKNEIKLVSDNKTFYYDFNYKNKIIEYNGDFWHCNPELYEAEYYQPRMKMYASEVWEKDKNKIDFAKENGYQVKIIWEKQIKKDEDKIIKECIDFIKEK